MNAKLVVPIARCPFLLMHRQHRLHPQVCLYTVVQYHAHTHFLADIGLQRCDETKWQKGVWTSEGEDKKWRKKNQEQTTMEQNIDFAENRLIGVMLFSWIPKWQCRKLLYATKATILLQESREWCARDHRCKQHGHGHQLPVLCRSMCGRTRVAHACTYALSICC